jgi:oxysterol-binding protein 1
MEEGNWDQANIEKERIENKQRVARREREQALAKLQENGVNVDIDSDDIELVNPNDPTKKIPKLPLWFKKTIDPYTKQPMHSFTNEYWECKEKKDWSKCPDLF